MPGSGTAELRDNHSQTGIPCGDKAVLTRNPQASGCLVVEAPLQWHSELHECTNRSALWSQAQFVMGSYNSSQA